MTWDPHGKDSSILSRGLFGVPWFSLSKPYVEHAGMSGHFISCSEECIIEGTGTTRKVDSKGNTKP